MQQLIQITDCALQHKKINATTPTTATGERANLRVPLYTNNNTRQTISMMLPNPQVPQLSPTLVPIVDQSTKTNHKHRINKHKTKFHTTAPVHNTRLPTQAAKAPPSINTRARTQLTKMEETNRTHINSRCSHSATGKQCPPRFGGHGHRHWQDS